MLMKSIARKLIFILSIFIIFFALAFSVVRFLTPILNAHRAEFEKATSALLNMPVKIKEVKVGWYRYQPVITLNQLTILNKTGTEPVLQLRAVRVVFSIPKSLWYKKIIPTALLIIGFEADVYEKKEGGVYVRGLSQLSGLNHSSDNQQTQMKDVIQFLSLQPKLVLQDMNIRYTTLKKVVFFLTLNRLSFENDNNYHVISGSGVLHQKIPTELSFIINWQGKEFDFNQLTGKAYIYAKGVLLPQWLNQISWRGFQIKEGILSAKIWTNFALGQVIKVQSQLKLYDVNLWNTDNQSMHVINRLSGNLGLKYENDQYIVAGDDLLIDLPHHLWPLTHFYFTFYKDFTPKIFNIGYINFEDVLPYVYTLNLLPKPQADMIKNLQLEGSLQNILLGFGKNWQNIEEITLDGAFDQISFMLPMPHLFIKNLSGHINWQENKGQLTLNSKAFAFEFNSLFKNKIKLTSWQGEIYIAHDKNQWLLRSDNLQLINNDGQLNLKGWLSLPESSYEPKVGLSGTFNLNDLARASHYLPLNHFHKQINEWLEAAFIKGEITEGKITLEGMLKDFPFDQSAGQFIISSNLKKAELHYADGWPNLKKIVGQMIFNNRTAAFNISNAEILNIPLNKITASIADLGNVNTSLIVKSSQVNTSFKQSINFINKTPLKNTIGKFLTRLNLKGNLNLLLSLDIPLVHPVDTKIKGFIQFNDAMLDLDTWDLPIHQLTGALNFTENSVNAQLIRGELFNKSVNFSIKTLIEKNPANNKIVGSLLTPILSSDLQNWLKLPNHPLVSGVTPINAEVIFSWSSPLAIQLSSNLEGIQINLEDPYGKKSNVKRPTQLVVMIPDDEPLKLRLNYDNLLNVASLLTYQNSSYKILSLNLSLGKEQVDFPKANDQFKLMGVLAKLDVANLMAYLKNQDMSAPNFFPPLSAIDLKVGQFNFFGQMLNHAHFDVSSEKQYYDVDLDSDEMDGQLEIPKEFNASKTLTVSLQKVILSGANAKQKNLNFDISSMPALKFVANRISYQGMQFDRLAFNTSSNRNGLSINHLTISAPHFNLNGEGMWVKNRNETRTELRGEAHSTNISKFLSNIGYDVHNFIANEAHFYFDLNWNDAPYAPSLPKLHGNARLKVGKGRIINVGAGTGMISMLNVFSLQSIPRRLSLDFRDVFQKGYIFDSLTGDYLFQQGDLNSPNTQFKGVIADVTIKGRIGLIRKDYNLSLDVTPYVTSGLPIAASLIWNPVVGLAAFGVDAILKSRVSKVITYHYQVTGPWSNPVWRSR